MAGGNHEALKCKFGISFAIHADDEFATTTEQFIHAEVFDVAAIGKVEPPLLFRHAGPGHLAQQAKESGRLETLAAARIANPEAKPNIEKGQEGRKGGHRTQTHVRRS